MPLHLVTFCAHQPYLHLFAKVDVTMDVIQLPQATRFLQNWDPRVRPLPPNLHLLTLEEARRRAAAGTYQAAMAHNINDYLDLLPLGLPLVLVMHTALSSRFAEERTAVDKEAYRAQYAELVRRTGGRLVFVTETKRADWGLPGTVITAGIDPDDYPRHSGEMPRLLRVTNHLKQRGGILGYSKHRTVARGFPIDVVGDNPGLAGAAPAASWDDLKIFYRTRRAFLHTALPVMEDGFNLAVLEAMAAGMPIVATANPSSPVEDGVNGYLDDDLDRLRECVRALLGDVGLARRLGDAARDTVAARFHYRRFAQAWQDLWADMTGG